MTERLQQQQICTVVWFRRNLRVEDNPALLAAARSGGPVVPVFIWCPEEEGQFQPGRVSRWWMKHSLLHLTSSLAQLGSPLLLRRSPRTLSALLEVVELTGATRVFFDHLYDPISLLRDHKVKQGLADRGISVQTFKGDLLYEPWEIFDERGQAFTTFSSFWTKCLSMPVEPDPPLLPPRRITPFSGELPSEYLSMEQLGLENDTEKSSNALLSRTWSPGWPHADKALDRFLAGPLCSYASSRRKADSTTTSLLSPHLHFGEISVRKIFHRVRVQQVQWMRDGVELEEESVNDFLRSLGLREYSRYLSFNFPFTHERSLLANLKHFPWRIDEGYFKSWRQGRTGYPLVDAGMRELWATGWLHCRLRVVVSSFFVKFLQLPWWWGMKYFWDTLLDADIENDVLGWQYISGSLPDGHELDRIEDPREQGVQLDPRGEYIRKWLPELSRVPTQWIHHPWDAPSSVLRAAGVELGSNYPRPVVDIAAARQRQKQALAEMWEADARERANQQQLQAEETMLEVGETMMDAGHAGQRAEVNRLHSVKNNSRQVGCSSWHDQMVPSVHRQQGVGVDLQHPEAEAVEMQESSSSAAAAAATAGAQAGAAAGAGGVEMDEDGDEEGEVKSGGAAVPVRSSSLVSASHHHSSSRVPDVRCGFVFRRHTPHVKVEAKDDSNQHSWVQRHLKRKL